jgi:hypothetical protein
MRTRVTTRRRRRETTVTRRVRRRETTVTRRVRLVWVVETDASESGDGRE